MGMAWECSEWKFRERAVILTRGQVLAAPLTELRKVKIDEPQARGHPDDIARIVKEQLMSYMGIHCGGRLAETA